MINKVYSLRLVVIVCMANMVAFSEEQKIEKMLFSGDSLAANVESKEINSIADAFAHGKGKGLLRYGAQHRDSKYHVLQDDPHNPTVKGNVKAYSALGGYLGYETAAYHYISLGATFYTSNPFIGNNSEHRKGLGGLYEEEGGQDAYTVLGEAYFQYKNDHHLFKIGRQELPNYKFVSLSNIRMSSFTHEAAIYENTTLKHLKFNIAYVTKLKDRNGVDFHDMVHAARVSIGEVINLNTGVTIKTKIRGIYDHNNFNTKGSYVGENKEMRMFSAIYDQENWKIEAWDYYVNDFVNTVYLYGEYKFALSTDWKMTLAGQYVNQQDTGESVAGDIDTWFYGVKAQSSFSKGMLFFLAYNEVAYNEASYDGGTLFVRWGTPQMFNSFQVQDSELSGTKSVGVGAQFDLGALDLLKSTVIRFRYAEYNMPDELQMLDARQDRTEATFDLRYSFEKESGFGIFTKLDGLSIQFRIAYDKFRTDYDFVAYENMHGFSIKSVDEDFVDARIYIDYQF